MTAPELIEYFENKKLPKTAKLKDGIITDCEKFVQTNLLRVKETGRATREPSTWLLKELYNKLEQKQ